MKLFYIITLLFAFCNLCFGDIWEGDYAIRNQEQANEFSVYCNCTSITGNLLISGNTIDHLNNLQDLLVVEGSVEISNNINLENIEGLSNLNSIGQNLILKNNTFIKDIFRDN